ncbi:MAG: hypothetical protein AABZ55_08610 [Bdellovibrionota bacterium]
MKKLLVILVVGLLSQIGVSMADDHAHPDATMIAGCHAEGVMVHVYKLNHSDRTYAMVKAEGTAEPIVLQIERIYAQDKLHYFLGQDFVLRIISNMIDMTDEHEHPFEGMLKFKLYKSGEKTALKCMLQ